MRPNIEDRIKRGDQTIAFLESDMGKYLIAFLDQREKDIVDSMLGDACRQARAYEVFSGRANEIRDIRSRFKYWVDDGEKAKIEDTKKGAAGA